MAKSVRRDPKTRPDGGLYIYNALAFSTLLSSQETDAHRVPVFVSVPRGDSFNLPGISVLSNQLRFDLLEPLAGFSIKELPSHQHTDPGEVVQYAREAPQRLSPGGSPGPGPPSGVPSPSGQDEPYGSQPPSSNRSGKLVMPDVAGSKPHPTTELPPLFPPLTIKAEAHPVQEAQPQVAAALAPVSAGDRRAGGLDDGRPQRLRRKRQRLAVDQGQPHSF